MLLDFYLAAHLGQYQNRLLSRNGSVQAFANRGLQGIGAGSSIAQSCFKTRTRIMKHPTFYTRYTRDTLEHLHSGVRMDIVFIIITAAFFAICAGFVRLASQLMGQEG